MADQLTIKINGNISDYEESLKDITKKTQKLQDNLSSIAKKAAVAFVGLGAAITGSIAAFRVQEQVELKTRQTIIATGEAAGLTAQEIFNMAGALQEVTAFGDEAIIGGQNLLLTFKNIGKDVFPRVTEVMLDMSAAMGTGLKESAIQLGKALNDPKVGLTALQRVGITFTEAQKEQIKTMQELGDVAGAQKIILKELESQFGGIARTTAKGTGAFIQLKNIVGDLVEDLGRELAPTFIDVAQEAKEFFLTLRDNKELIKTVATVLKFSLGLAGIVAVAASVGVAILKVSAIIGALSAAFLPATIAATGFWAAVTGPIGIAVAGIALVTAGVFKLWSALKEKDASKELEETNSKLKSLKRTQGQLNQFIKDSKGVNSEVAIERLKQIDDEIKALEDLKKKKVEVSTASTEEEVKKDEDEGGVDQKAIDRLAATEERKKEERQKAFEDKKSQLLENQELLTEEELEAAQEAAELKEEKTAENELIAQAAELERKGQHGVALALLEDARVQKQIKDSDKILKVKKDTDKKDLDNKKKLAALEKDLAIKTSNAKVTLVKNTANLVQTILGKESKAAFIIGKIVAAGDVLLADSKSRAWAAAASLSAASAAGPAAPAVFAASMASYNAILTANTAIALGTIAAQTVTGFADGGLAIGGIDGVDSIPAMLQNNEFVSPAQNFEEVIGSVRAKREAEDLTGEGGFGAQLVDIRVSYDSPEASQIVTVSQVEDTALGISRDSFKESA